MSSGVDPALLQSFYDQFYYDTYAFGQRYSATNPHWRDHFARFADTIVSELAPKTAIDLGCGPGLLVEALRERGVEAWGVDLSDYAIEHAADGAREFCRVGSISDPLDRTYDLVICIEVIEHVPAQYADDCVANMAEHGRRVLFSSAPDDFKDPSHTNVRPIEHWIGLFGRHGLYRDLEFDATFVTPHAICFHRPESPLDVIRTYERHWFRVTQELREVREANVLIVADRAHLTAELARVTGQPPPVDPRRPLVWRLSRWVWRRLPERARRAIRG
jgi:SAM-dependent methyltransferase